MKQTNLITKHCWLYLCGVFVVFSSVVWAAEPRQRGRENDRSEAQTREEQMQQEAREYASKITPALRDLLEPVQKNQQPSKDLVQKAQSVLEDTKRHFLAFDDKPKAQFMLLQSWTAFYQDDLTQAMGWSKRACRTNGASQDAWTSQAVFSMLSGKRPALPRIEKPKPRPERPERSERQTSRRRSRNNDTGRDEDKPQPYSEKGILEFDLLGLKSRVFREQFGRMELQTASGKKIEYEPGTNTLCMLFWEEASAAPATPAAPADANDPRQQLQKEMQKGAEEAIRQVQEAMEGEMPEGVKEEVQKMMQEAIPEMMTGMNMDFESSFGSQTQNADIKSQQNYFKRLMDACEDDPEIKFVQINTVQPKQLETFLSGLPDYSERTIPMVIAAAPDSNGQQFVGWDAEKPFMAIVDKEGKVRYAGPAADFVPAFILTELTGVQIDLANQSQSVMAGQTETPMFGEMMMFMEGQPAADPNKPAANPNVPAKKEPPMRPRGEFGEFPTQPLEDQVRAEKLLESAKMEIGKSIKLRSNPKRGIEDCRKILAQFPKTQYAQQARELLRKVPDRYKEMNNITDEELGY